MSFPSLVHVIISIGCTYLLQSKHPDSFLALSFIHFRFLALYRPSLWDLGTVNGTQTGISKHSL